MKIEKKIDAYFKTNIHEDAGHGWVNHLKLNGVSIQRTNKNTLESYVFKNGLVVEAKEMTFEEKGGIIVFSTNVNVEKGTGTIGKIKTWLKNKMKTLSNVLQVDKKLDKVIKKNPEVYGFSIGNFFKGRYKAQNGDMYNEKSLSIEIIGISSDVLEKVGKEIAQQFNQENVLIKDYQTGEIYLENRK